MPIGSSINLLRLLSDRLRPKNTSAITATYLIAISRDVRHTGKLSASSAKFVRKTLVASAMIVMMNDLSFRLGLVSLTGFIICGVVGIHLVGSVVSCFLVHKELLAGP